MHEKQEIKKEKKTRDQKQRLTWSFKVIFQII